MKEITVIASLAYSKPPASASLQTLFDTPTGVYNITGNNFVEAEFLVPTTAGGTAIPVPGLGTLGWACIKNNDTTNYVDILSAVSGTPMLRLYPGECFPFRFHPGVTAPAAIANTASVNIQYLILQN